MFNIPLRVENLILKYDTANPYQLAKCLKFDVFELDLPSEIRGFLVRPLRRKCIVLNANLSELQKRIVLCHELTRSCTAALWIRLLSQH
ncbi:ImmA/IrrE family metallo-endopeptidase [Phascolarctobacterium faecium]|uniref:ImmA/IrrE family metallo-endopeptidase n=1 Tax=Phascolarctobacterium faecium TaxID=33025 RepID=UPI003B589FE2